MIVLYNPWSTPSEKKPLPMSLLSLAATLEGKRPWTIVDGNLLEDPVDHIVQLAEKQPLTAIGITVMPGPQLNHAVPDSRRLKQALPDVPIIWGGYFPSQHADTVLQDAAVDYCIHGQGEETFLELLEVLEHGGSLASIPGLIYSDDGSTRHNPRRALIPLDDLPEWPYEKIEMERYFHHHYLGNRVGTHHSSYGCPFGCNFCAVVDLVNRRWVAQSPEKLAGTVEHLHRRWGIDALQFHDMDFFISEKRTAEFAERIRGLGITWWALGRVDELMGYSDSTWSSMRSSGLKMAFCGAETGSDEMLDRMNKGGKSSTSLTLELARRMKSFDVVPEFSFVLGNPPDPVADIDSTLAFIRRLKQVNSATEVILYSYTPVPLDGKLFEEARALGFRYPDTLDQWVSGDWRDFSLRRDPHTPWFDPRLKRKVRNFERVLNAYYPTVTDTHLGGLKRRLLQTLAGWRYNTETYAFPAELRLFQHFFSYQRPETTGF